jgi:hypothetical protein
MILRRTAFLILGVLLISWTARHCGAVLFYSTADPDYNTEAPQGDLAGSGWDTQGRWGLYLGTAIGPYHFITAKHVGGAVGDPFVIEGTSYTVAELFDDSESDLRIARVTRRLPTAATLYARPDEEGQNVVVFGRGTTRGEPVVADSTLGPQLRGWRWGGPDLRMKWGENRIERSLDGSALGFGTGMLLRCTFDPDQGPNECHLSAGDSGGGLFIRDGPQWKLAGVHYAVDGPYALNASGEGFQAALFDERRLYKGEPGSRTFTPNLPVRTAGGFYSSRISSRLEWIGSVLAMPLPGPVLESAPSITGPFTLQADAHLSVEAGEFSIPRPDGPVFFRLRSEAPLLLRRIQISGDQVLLQYSTP